MCSGKLNNSYDIYGIGTAYQIKTDDIGVNWLRTRVGVMAGVHPAIRQLRLNRQASSAVFQLGAIPELLGPQEPLDGFLRYRHFRIGELGLGAD